MAYEYPSLRKARRGRPAKKGVSHSVTGVTDPKERERILKTIQAIEGYVMCSCIALGLLQILAMHFSGTVNPIFFRCLRTSSKETMPEATVACYLRKSIFRSLDKNKDLRITRIITSKEGDLEFDEVRQAS